MAAEHELQTLRRPDSADPAPTPPDSRRRSRSGSSSSSSSRSSTISRSTLSSQPSLDAAAGAALLQPAAAHEKPAAAAALPRLRPQWLFRAGRHVRYRLCTTYRVLFVLVVAANARAAHSVATRARPNYWSTTSLLVDVSDCVAANVLLAVLARQDYLINLLFRLCWLVPFAVPLAVRRRVAGVYGYGGVHSGAALCATLWYSLAFRLLVKEFWAGRMLQLHLKVSTYVILLLVWAMVVTAYPRFRFFWHNTFEHVHRWAGWILVILFWVELVYLSENIAHNSGPSSPGARLTRRVAFWCHLASTIHIFLPWLRLRRLAVEVEHLSSHTIRLYFAERVSNCVVYRISCSPLGEWHAFASIPDRNGPGGSLLVSDGGDWTRRTINSPGKYYYTRGTPTVGVLCMAQIFRKVVIVTTGSGIGPCLGTMTRIASTSCRVLWTAPSPQQTFGDDIYNTVLEVDSEAVILDTWRDGRPDLVQLAYELYIDSGAEAIFCVSNRNLTRTLVYEMECRGVPAYGPIWDS